MYNFKLTKNNMFDILIEYIYRVVLFKYTTVYIIIIYALFKM